MLSQSPPDQAATAEGLLGASSATASVESLLSQRLADYWQLTKPGITMLVLVTTCIGYAMGAPAGGVDAMHLLATLVGTCLLVMGGGCMNMVLEAEIDARMPRTARRPIPAGRLTAESATVFGMLLSVAGSTILWTVVGPLAAMVGTVSWILYVFVYTWLKPISSLATPLGAIPGALPPVIGFAAASGTLAVEGWLLFSIMFFWQFPHFLAIGWMYREQYRQAGLKPLAVEDPAGVRSSRQIRLYTVALLPVALLPTALGMNGMAYAACALALSVYFLKAAWRCSPERLDAEARRLFFTSIAYLPALLGAMVIDRMLF